VARMGEERKVYKVLVGKTKGKRPLGRPRRRWEDVIRMYLGEIDLGGVDWFRLAQDRDRLRAVVSAVMNLRVLAPRTLSAITKYGWEASICSRSFRALISSPSAIIPTYTSHEAVLAALPCSDPVLQQVGSDDILFA
jgi:hypothetical protein